ncbi:MAG: TonB-dependent receptor [Gammaproteobacteria bacterium]|nr:TonB-dependent receptor [Gammaproteobacteria bacterium]
MKIIKPLVYRCNRKAKHSDPPVRSRLQLSSLLIGVWVLLSTQLAAADMEKLKRLKSFSLEELAEVEVSIGGKLAQKASDIPAAVYVITQDDIRSSGATNIPEVLRMVPGLHVARIDANKWIVSSRGFSSRITNKLLVMIDGRSVYSPLFSGVLWEQQDLVLEDVDRIEVIRGPGAAVWGANAVNGVINILTRHTAQTQGTLLTGTAGTEQSIAVVRNGGKLAEDAHYRAYLKYRYQDDSQTFSGDDAKDALDDLRAGFRVDWAQSERDTFSFMGDAYTSETSEQITTLDLEPPNYAKLREDDIQFSGANLVGKWKRTYADGAQSELKTYVDYTERKQWILDENRSLFDIDYRYQTLLGSYHDLSFGAGYRYSKDQQKDGNYSEGQVRVYSPSSKTEHLYSAFVQDDMELQEGQWWLTLGTKLEHNDYTGYEVQPNLRLRWQVNPVHMTWGAISRAVRTPSRAERDGFLVTGQIDPGPPPVAPILEGSDAFDSEELVAYELGYRFQPTKHVGLDANVFFNDYDQLQSFEYSRTGSAPAPITAVGNVFNPSNQLYGETYGAELSFFWRAGEHWQWRVNYSFLEINLETTESSTDIRSERFEGYSPEHQFNILSSYQWVPGLRLNAFIRYVDALPSLGVDEYLELDLGAEWQINPSVTLSVYGRNLLNDAHTEAMPSLFATMPTEVEREFYMKLTGHF